MTTFTNQTKSSTTFSNASKSSSTFTNATNSSLRYNFILLESGSYVLQETGDKIRTESDEQIVGALFTNQTKN